MDSRNYCLILAGGTGQRLWPVSRSTKPKQFLDLFGTGRTLLQQTYDRVARFIDADKIYDFYNLKEGINQIDSFVFETIYTPGHKDDCITTYFIEDKVMFTGDFLFYGSIGRTDFPGGSNEKMFASLKKILF